MAKAKAEPKGEWRHFVVGRAAVAGTSTTWKAQKSIAPDGKKFVGIRKFAIKKDGTEQVTSTGVSFAYTKEGAHKDEIKILIDLLKEFL